MGRGKGGQYEEKNDSPIHKLGELLEFGDKMRKDKEDALAAKQAYEHAGSDPLLQTPSVRRGTRRAAITLTLSLSAIDAIDRLAIVRGERRGYVLDDLIMAAARTELKGEKTK